MALLTAEPGKAPALQLNPVRWLEVAFVNNMPESAFLATEAQFLGLLECAARNDYVQVRRYTFPGIERHGDVAGHVREHYLSTEVLWNMNPAALIVTGCEPFAESLTEEPYWGDLAYLLKQARDRTVSMWASCLAAHAALLEFEGVSRHRLPAKCSGVLDQQVRHPHPLTVGMPDRLGVPHSRMNEVPGRALANCGFDALLVSSEGTWTTATKEYDSHLLVLMQGHLEYKTETLLLEFRRDVRRYLAGTRTSPPDLPAGYLNPAGESMAADFIARVRHHPDPDAMRSFPFAELVLTAANGWREPAERMVGNWLAEVRRRATMRDDGRANRRAKEYAHA